MMLNLYRGDSFFNKKSNPGMYRSEGLTSSALGAGGDPKNIERLSLLETVKRHIDHLKCYENDYYKITDYISFSECEETAKLWASDLKPDDLIDCLTPYQETRYVFNLQIPEAELISISKGVWEFNYACNKDLKSSNIDNEIESFVLRYNTCPLCGSVKKIHNIILVKPSLFMSDVSGEINYKRAITLGEKNTEWLILPNDSIGNNFRSTRIQRANFWTANHYILRNESRSDVDLKSSKLA